MMAKPGTMFIVQPDIPVPLEIDFLFRAWPPGRSKHILARTSGKLRS